MENSLERYSNHEIQTRSIDLLTFIKISNKSNKDELTETTNKKEPKEKSIEILVTNDKTESDESISSKHNNQRQR